LCEVAAVQVLPSVPWLDARAQRRAHVCPAAPVTLAVSRFPGRQEQWGALPGAPEECDAIERELGCEAPLRLREEGAAGEAVLDALSQADWLHAATHGELDIDVPHRSRLLLASEPDLSIEALEGKDLRRVAGVVLSACEVQLAVVMPGQEAISLPV